MSHIRIKFTRGRDVKYISHLDLMKVFERAIRRSGIPITYSQGFNPHPQMVFGLPLAVGVTSEAEYADMEFTEDVDPDVLIERLNRELPAGLRLLQAAERKTRDNIMASVALASYLIIGKASSEVEPQALEKAVADLLGKQEIPMRKEGKKGVREVDIRPMIHTLTSFAGVEGVPDAALLLEEYDGAKLFCLSALLGAGSASNLKPDLLFSAFSGLLDSEAVMLGAHRTGLFVEKNGVRLDPLDEAAV